MSTREDPFTTTLEIKIFGDEPKYLHVFYELVIVFFVEELSGFSSGLHMSLHTSSFC